MANERGMDYRIQIYILFFKSTQEREMVSLEERSLELFGHEKFLLDSDIFPDGKGFLTRIGISEEQLENGELRRAFCILDETRERNKRYSTSTHCRKSIILSYFH